MDLEKNVAYKSKNNSNSLRIYWELISDKELDVEAIEHAQSRAGYMPMGYGGPNDLKTEHLADGTIKHSWYCSSSCD